MELDGRVALITGASGGLGAVTARMLAEHGVHVAVTHREHRDECIELCRHIETLGRRAVCIQLDQTDPASCSAAVDTTVRLLGRLDIVVNNAAWNDGIPLPDLHAVTPEIWDRSLNTNLRGPFLVTRAAARHLAERQQGRVVNVSGLPGLVPAGSLALAVSKAGLIHLTRCLAVALGPSITVNCVAPGRMEGTRMSARVPAARVAAHAGVGDRFAAWTEPEAAFEILKALSAGRPCDFSGVDGYRMLDAQGGVQWPHPAGSTVPGRERRLFADGRFFTSDGRACLVVEAASS
jgi:3-oxoacyl-[acyl-carrier protein] reductase